MSPSWLREVRWRAREEAVAAATGPKRREPMASGARQRESARLLPNKRLSSFEGMKQKNLDRTVLVIIIILVQIIPQ
jgi:hypothetical protein